MNNLKNIEKALLMHDWVNDEENKCWHTESNQNFVAYHDYPNIYFYEQTPMGHFRGCLTVTEMALFLEWFREYAKSKE